ncbi:MAG: hypothetical protein OXI84_04970 [bacterium]|nr:hypothetical protein [bacterium]
MTFDCDVALRLIVECLGLVERLGADPIDVRQARMSDRTLVVEITARSIDPITVRGEICGVMGALSGLGIPELFPVLHTESFGVRAYDDAGEELLWVVSSIETAGFAGDGRAVEWLANSLFQDNTPAYRRSQADRTIGQVETGLRELLDHHGLQRIGDAYPNQLWSLSELSRIKSRADDEGRYSHDARTLLDYVFLPQLRDAIVDHRDWFDDGCLPDPDALKVSLEALNTVRRKVAHHREISSDELRDCRAIARICLTPIGGAHPYLIEDFLVDRWEEQAAQIVDGMRAGFDSADPPPAGSMPETQRRQIAIDALTAQQLAVNEALSSLSRLVVPPSRQQLHDAAVKALTHWQTALAHLIAAGSNQHLTTTEVQAASAVYGEALDHVREVAEEIRRLRVSAPTE